MSDFYTRMRATADRLLGDKGAAIAWEIRAAVYNPATGTTEDDGSGESFDAQGLLLPQADLTRMSGQSFEVGLTTQERQGFMLAASPFLARGVRPGAGHYATVGGETYRIAAVGSVEPGADPVVFFALGVGAESDDG